VYVDTDLIDFIIGEWNADVVRSVFSGTDAQILLNMPLSRHWPSDNLYYSFAKNGEYSVKSGYWLAKLGSIDMNEETENGVSNTGWKGIWSLQGPSKLKFFVWKAYKGSLAVKERLRHRHIVNDLVCPICNASNVTIFHALFECEAAFSIWQNHPLSSKIGQAPDSSFCERWDWMLSNLSAHDLRFGAPLMWAAWSCRNKIYFENARLNPYYVAVGFVKMVEEHMTYAQRVFDRVPSALSIDTAGQVSASWSFPLAGGKLILCATKKTHVESVELAEALAARFGVQVVRRFGYTNINLECDASNVVNAIKNHTRDFSPLFLVH
uniref:Reverse transcriptase zinc-binding domain-containing protein n=1 Tax=Chenopodium quinoa TaxID=63459 RepID=A0A803LV44_CHEQI